MQSANPRFSEEAAKAAHRHLKELVDANPQVVLSVLTSGDGFELAAHPSRQPHTQRVAAMSSSLQALSEAIVREAGLTNSRSLIIESETGTILVLGLANITPRVSLAVVAAGNELLGRLLWAARNCCHSLERSLQQS
jgi:predicted regulator of Ras-like GTPase activity (Roadblock/LC7/MglB family)